MVDSAAVQKLEGQTWCALYNLMSKPQSAEKYSVNEYRRSVLLRLLGRINDDVINQGIYTDNLCVSIACRG